MTNATLYRATREPIRLDPATLISKRRETVYRIGHYLPTQGYDAPFPERRLIVTRGETQAAQARVAA
jgi:hypothetical protein